MTDDLAAMANADQHEAEIRDTAGRVAAYFRTLTAAGIERADAAELARDYNAMVLARHFEVDMNSITIHGLMVEDDD